MKTINPRKPPHFAGLPQLWIAVSGLTGCFVWLSLLMVGWGAEIQRLGLAMTVFFTFISFGLICVRINARWLFHRQQRIRRFSWKHRRVLFWSTWIGVVGAIALAAMLLFPDLPVNIHQI